jgi:PhnB protein
MSEQYPTVIPMLAYENGAAAMDWLVAAFGFKERTRMMDESGRLSHGELEAGGGLIMIASPSPAYQSPRHHGETCAAAREWLNVPWIVDGVLVYVDDVVGHFERARQCGAAILSEPEHDWPGPRYRVEDIEGHRWMFMQRPVST